METLEALAVFFKIPEKGRVKTRLAKEIGDDKALEIYKGLLLKTINLAETFHSIRQVKLFAFFDGKCLLRNTEFFNLKRAWRFIPQERGDLGIKLKRAGDLLLALNFKKVVMIGSDCPVISVEYLREAYANLEKYPVVIGPAKDGGYVLIGFNYLFKDRLFLLFDDLPFETTRLLEKTLKRLSPGDYYLLPGLFDIDTLEDYQNYLYQDSTAKDWLPNL